MLLRRDEVAMLALVLFPSALYSCAYKTRPSSEQAPHERYPVQNTSRTIDMGPKKNSSSEGARTPSGSPGPVILFYPYRQGRKLNAVSHYLADITSRRSRRSHPSRSVLSGAYADQPMALEAGNSPHAYHAASGPTGSHRSGALAMNGTYTLPNDTLPVISGSVRDTRHFASDTGSHESKQPPYSLAGQKRQHSPELTGSHSPSASQQLRSSSPSKVPRLAGRKGKDKQKDAELQRHYRSDKNEKLRKLNSMLPDQLRCKREPPRMPPIIDSTIEYIDSLTKQLESSNGPDRQDLLDEIADLSERLNQSYLENSTLRLLLTQREQTIAFLSGTTYT
ncbi:hypothetical protein EVG20_g4441 [Dentipellis fragilis]|uniref:BHLH domain-containing protein n=1 Tax=Dentipellis fragilis TaxID=205917 RepID=A0A4Y9YYB0_9AGAM|nr:hypothetical protein EVG20_g4441 [Dentipellis fragilis]